MNSPSTSGGRRKKSSKRSAAKPKPQPKLTFYVDECLGRQVPTLLAAAGFDVRPWYDHFPGQQDVTWLPHIGARGWVLLTKDKNIRRNVLEVRAILNADVRAFALVATDMTGVDQAQVFIDARRRIARIAQQPGPFIYTLTRTGILTQIPNRVLRQRARQR
jgi:hypothetical protein